MQIANVLSSGANSSDVPRKKNGLTPSIAWANVKKCGTLETVKKEPIM